MAAVPRTLPLVAPRASPDRAEAEPGMMTALGRMASAAGAPVTHLMADFAALSLGQGRVAFADYERLRLWDAGFWGLADRREVVGARRGRELVRQANVRHDAFALAADRLASGAYLAAHGLPSVPLLAIYREGLAAPGGHLLRTRDQLRQFLEERAGEPLVARPAEGGSARFLFADPRLDPAAEVDRMVDEAADTPGVSWLFQPRIAPHPSHVRRLGGRLTSVRCLTLAGDLGPRVFRGLWRLGGRDDLVASLELKSGHALELFPAAAPHRAQPAPADLVVPEWSRLKATATEGARLFTQFGLLGWDVAAAAGGPVILGLDPSPDFDLFQLADRRGLLGPEFLAFLAERRQLAGG
jgi:hypothetical protein